MSASKPPELASSPKAPTMREVAALAGVALKTVSRVINGEPGVSPALVARVNDAVARLGYQPNLTARSLRRTDQKTAAIGLVLDDTSNPFSSALFRAIEDVAAARGILVFAGSSDEDPEREAVVLRALVARRVDGLIVSPASHDLSGFLLDSRWDRPLVLVDRRGAFPLSDCVVSDNREGVVRAVEHLARQGHRRIAFLGDLSSIWTANERYLGYVDGLRSVGLAVDQTLVHRELRGAEAAESAVTALLDGTTPPTAAVTGQNLLTIGAIRALRRFDRQHSFALVGFDDFPLAEMLDPSVSVVAQDVAAIGRAAAERLFARLDGDVSPPQKVVIPTRLIVRGSGEIAA
jgi:LacI family transcriptional regulator